MAVAKVAIITRCFYLIALQMYWHLSSCRLGRADKPKSATMAISWLEYQNDTVGKIDGA